VTEKARHYGYAANIGKEVDPAKGLVLQFELKLADGLTCGGAYLKFLTASAEFDASGLVEDTPYVVMFGPDKCGATNKVGVISGEAIPCHDCPVQNLEASLSGGGGGGDRLDALVNLDRGCRLKFTISISLRRDQGATLKIVQAHCAPVGTPR